MARTRTTKKLAQRIDLNYFKRPTPFKRAKLLLSFIVPLVAVGWIGWRGFARRWVHEQMVAERTSQSWMENLVRGLTLSLLRHQYLQKRP